MIDVEEIERTIDEIVATHDTSYRTCERLAWLYVVRDHLRKPKIDEMTMAMSGSDFLEAASNVDYISLMKILDTHMSALAVVQPREYESIMDKIRNLR